ncbi:mannosyl-oligosaccharide alpha-1,2-mannosidase [Exophiala viscosa]|uniref:alpha-1,2-Mannosidase n=1 Tax=Exophiala viscosa TaxID=2486360 RepID=A0AAN6DQB2_9EURO|nr:mannosyl-oligosaccharide alpha-1,2-mannosidase [Exophiala viscosa]
MFRVRRYRIFLVVALVLVGTVYHLTRVNKWDGTTLEGLMRFRPDAGKTPISDSAAPPEPISPPSVSSDALPPEIKTAPAVAAPVDSQSAAVSNTPVTTAPLSSSAPESKTTLTGDELLVKQTNIEEDFGERGQGRYEVKQRPDTQSKAYWSQQPEHFPVPTQSLITLPTGQPKTLPKIQYDFGRESSAAKTDRQRKQSAIRLAFKHAWNGYRNHSMPHDELMPISKGSADPFNGWGATLVDSLDTLWIVGLRDDFEEAVDAVAEIDFKTSARKDIPLFETTIRYLGGLIAAYDVSAGKYRILLDKAVELAEVLMGAFDTPNRMPIGYYNWAPSYASQPHRAGTHTVMSELGSLAMEFTRLAQITKEQKYYDAIARVTNALEKWQMQTEIPGLWPLRLDASGCKKPEVVRTVGTESLSIPVLSDELEADALVKSPAGSGEIGDNSKESSTLRERQVQVEPVQKEEPSEDEAHPIDGGDEPLLVTNTEWAEDYDSVDCAPQALNYEPHSLVHAYGIGAMADSTYEYFPKMHALLGGLSPQYESMYLDSMDAVRRELLFRPMTKENNDILFAAKQDIAPLATESSEKKSTVYEGTHLGCFAGGMVALGAKMFDISGDMSIAEKLTDGCVWAYASTPIGVMPEAFQLVPCDSLTACTWNETKWHEALDPNREQRIAAVKAYNLYQQRLHEEMLDEVESSTDDSSPSHVTSDPSMGKRDGVSFSHDDGQLSKPSSSDTDGSLESEQMKPPEYVPRVPLSHEKYVAARIMEERLPPGYTRISGRYYTLRPEAIESVWYMYRITGDESWREKGWNMFDAVDRATKTEIGNAAITDVTSQLNEHEDSMESFWLAETLKYFYLLFSEPDLISLDDYVLNTEAHPFRRPT